jgi:molecular chaperone GrpE
MAAKDPKDQKPEPEGEEPKVHDKRKIDPVTGEARDQEAQPGEARDQEAPTGGSEAAEETVELSDDDLALLAEAERDLVAEYRDRAARAEAELKNFRTRVERDRAANRDAVIAEVIRSLLPVVDDLDLAEEHGDLAEGSPLALVAQKLRAGFERYGLQRVGEKGDAFDPKLHEAIAQVYSKDVTVETVADVIQPGYALGERLLRAAKVAVSVPEPS